MPDDIKIEARVKAMESIHSHNLAAAITIKAGEVKSILGENIGVEGENLRIRGKRA